MNGEATKSRLGGHLPMNGKTMKNRLRGHFQMNGKASGDLGEDLTGLVGARGIYTFMN